MSCNLSCKGLVARKILPKSSRNSRSSWNSTHRKTTVKTIIRHCRKSRNQIARHSRGSRTSRIIWSRKSLMKLTSKKRPKIIESKFLQARNRARNFSNQRKNCKILKRIQKDQWSYKIWTQMRVEWCKAQTRTTTHHSHRHLRTQSKRRASI